MDENQPVFSKNGTDLRLKDGFSQQPLLGKSRFSPFFLCDQRFCILSRIGDFWVGIDLQDLLIKVMDLLDEIQEIQDDSPGFKRVDSAFN